MLDLLATLETTIPSPPADAGPAQRLEQLLRDQQDLTAVEQFARTHGAPGVSPRAQQYRQLLPATPPGAGQQYAFEVDLDRCSGCKACVTSCHNLNGLDAEEAWRDVGLLLGGTSTLPVLQHVTTACHHCLEPACLAACPVNAYEKDPLTGIVKHLDDQCFGCQYCTLACPYDVPKYHSDKGIVRKCDMCSTRLTAGEAPACVQACPTQAIAIRVVSVEQVLEDAEAALFLPAAPDPQITYPTTTYKTQRVLPRNMLPADYFQVSRQHPHWPLVIMLVLTQLSVGAFACGIGLEWFIGQQSIAAVRPVQAVMALVFGLLALGSSVFHLGRPRYAYRAVLGLGHSWLSREIVVFGIFAALACAYAAAVVAPNGWLAPQRWINLLAGSVAAVGALAVLCSVMIYASVRRDLWDFSRTATRFALTSAMLGLATLWLSLAALATLRPDESHLALLTAAGPPICYSLMAVASLKLGWEALLLRHLLSRTMTSLKRSALLMVRDLANPAIARFALGGLGGLVAPALLLPQLMAATALPERQVFAVATLLLFGASLAGELLERYLFFAAVASPRMPGGIR
ncbi:MAG: dimethyl sulfoxide reductase anchor subunit [Planctomycetaceae bacterium]|nr:dimethyl sulfoxide reductase anchor subunit [Planctomycetaceae bacterium]